jgi:hypothetical protein
MTQQFAAAGVREFAQLRSQEGLMFKFQKWYSVTVPLLVSVALISLSVLVVWVFSSEW